MKVTNVQRIAEHGAKGAPMCGFVDYIDAEKPILLRRMGWQIASDLHDAYSDEVSTDNGRTWSKPRLSLSCIEEDGGYVVFVENATHYDAERDLFLHITDQLWQPDLNGPNENASHELRITLDTPQAFLEGTTKPPLVSRFGIEQGVCISFTHILKDKHGRLLVTVQGAAEDTDKRFSNLGHDVRSDLPNYTRDVWECRLVIGTWNEDNTLDWQVSNPVPVDVEKSSRGLCEGTLAELPDGRLAMVLRGSNAAFLDRPGYKWVSYSEDGGLNWSAAVPLTCDDGNILQSSATGSCLLRSATNGKLYWIGNLCQPGEQASGNFPRSPLVIAEVQEEPFALRRDTITVIDDRHEGEDEYLQLSNFRAYQDRESGEVVINLTRFGERGSDGNDWMLADWYQYRVSLG